MVYLRAKKTKTGNYLYLVKSTWDKERNTSKQDIIKYLGRASEASIEDIPAEYRDNPKVVAALASHSPKSTKNKDRLLKKSRDILLQNLLDGDIRVCESTYRDYVKIAGPGDFLERILKPIMYKIGDDWHAGRISIASEHIASNTAQTLVRRIIRQIPAKSARGKVLICVPAGEEHRLPCDMLEAFLAIKGFKVFNMGSPIPTKSILRFIKENMPDCILVSITLKDNLAAGHRLVKNIRDQYDIPVFVGGQALQSKDTGKFQADVMQDTKLEHILKTVRGAVSG